MDPSELRASIISFIGEQISNKREVIFYVTVFRNERTCLDKIRANLTIHDARSVPDLLVVDSGQSSQYKPTAEAIRQALDLIGFKPLDVEQLLRATLETRLFTPCNALGGRIAIPSLYEPGKSNLVLVLGENAGGKSMFRRIVRMMTHKGRKAEMGEPAIEPGEFAVTEMVQLSMEARAGGGMIASFIYGAESYRSTGENSAHTVSTGIKTVCGRSHTNILYWDEPDIGMSAGSAAGAGVAIREFVSSGMSPLTQAVFLTSHSPALVRQLVSLKPHYIYLGNLEGPKTLDEWFKWQADPPPVSPEQLKDASRKRFHDIKIALDED